MSEWNDISDTSTVEVSEITEDIGETVWDMEEKPEKLAADYVRSFEGFDKAALIMNRTERAKPLAARAVLLHFYRNKKG